MLVCSVCSVCWCVVCVGYVGVSKVHEVCGACWCVGCDVCVCDVGWGLFVCQVMPTRDSLIDILNIILTRNKFGNVCLLLKSHN